MPIRSDIVISPKTSTIGEATPLRVSATPKAILQLAPGAEVRADILGALTNGRTLVKIAGDVFTMELPESLKAGESLQMTFLGSEPRPTFSYSVLQNRPTPVNLSDAGRWLSQTTHEEVGSAPETGQLPRLASLAAGFPLDTAKLTATLREAVASSGVFYESHLAEWAAGKRDLASVLLEPQASLSPRPAGQPLPLSLDAAVLKSTTNEASGEQPTAATHALTGATAATSRPMAQPGAETEVEQLIQQHGKELAAAAPAGQSQYRAEGMIADSRTAPLVREQLATLYSGVFAWQGEAWPGQPMEWRIEDRDARQQETSEGRGKSELKVELPHLGTIVASFRIRGNELSLSLAADAESTTKLMKQEVSALEGRLASAGLNLNGLVIRHVKTE